MNRKFEKDIAWSPGIRNNEIQKMSKFITNTNPITIARQTIQYIELTSKLDEENEYLSYGHKTLVSTFSESLGRESSDLVFSCITVPAGGTPALRSSLIPICETS